MKTPSRQSGPGAASLKWLKPFAFLLAASVAVPAAAEDLFTVWSINLAGDVAEMNVREDEPFLELRLEPLRLVRLTAPAQISRREQLAAGTFLFLVMQRDGQTAYCTIKDQSLGNVARSMFIPVLDRRPCLVDADRDGMFEARFGVFDKYGSALTPSGNLSSARELSAPVAYEVVDSALFPVIRSFSFAIDGVGNPQSRRIVVSYDNGSGYVPMENISPDSTPERLTSLNVAAELLEVNGAEGRVRVSVDRSKYVVGDSDGDFVVEPLPTFAAGL